MLASSLLAASAVAQEPPAGLIKRIRAVETAAQQAQSNYTYRQSVTVEELDSHGAIAGDYREVRDIGWISRMSRKSSSVSCRVFQALQRRTEKLFAALPARREDAVDGALFAGLQFVPLVITTCGAVA
jgi:hypothetical protein